MGESRRKRLRCERDAEEAIQDMLRSGEWKLLIDGDALYAVDPKTGEEYKLQQRNRG